MLSVLGKFHPLIVHLPIGILLLNALLVFLSKKERYSNLKYALDIVLLCGTGSAILACITGWLLAQSGEYDSNILNYHQWIGISVAGLSLLMYFLKKSDNTILWGILILLLAIGGHFGGTLTHGENYLFNIKTAENDKLNGPNTQALAGLAVTPETKVYNDIIQPILKNKCYNCHNVSKQKGKLRLDNQADILKGGENGVIILAGKADESGLYERLVLDLNHDDHMPPKGKPQLTKDEIALIHWWITEGVPFDKTVKDLKQNEAIKTVFNNIKNNTVKNDTEPKGNDMVPTQIIEKADNSVLDSLKKAGIIVLPVAPNSPYLTANLISLFKVDNTIIEKLLPVAKQLIWLKLGGSGITDSAMTTLSQFKNLTKLYLNDTKITDIGLAKLSDLKQLQYLNLVNTNISASGLHPLSKLPQLQHLYIYKTQVKSIDFAQLTTLFSKTLIDTGGYIVPIYESDTSVLKRKKS